MFQDSSINTANMASDAMDAGLIWLSQWNTRTWNEYEEFIGSCIRNKSERDRLLKVRLYGGDIYSGGPKMPSNVPGLRLQVRTAFRESFETDPATAMAAIRVPGQGIRPLSYSVFENGPLIGNLLDVGTFGIISGPPGSGKTNLSIRTMEDFSKYGNSFTNIRLSEEWAVFCPTASALIAAAVTSKVPWLWVLDEGAPNWRKAKATTNKSQNLEIFVTTFVRKMEGRMLFVQHRPENTPSVLAAWATSFFFVPEKGRVNIDLRGPRIWFAEKIEDFEIAETKYGTKDFSPFNVDVNIEAMFNEIAGVEPKKQSAAILSWLAKPKGS